MSFSKYSNAFKPETDVFLFDLVASVFQVGYLWSINAYTVFEVDSASLQGTVPLKLRVLPPNRIFKDSLNFGLIMSKISLETVGRLHHLIEIENSVQVQINVGAIVVGVEVR